MITFMQAGGQQERFEQRTFYTDATFMEKFRRAGLVKMGTLFSQEIHLAGTDMIAVLVLNENRISSGNEFDSEKIGIFSGKRHIWTPTGANRAINL